MEKLNRLRLIKILKLTKKGLSPKSPFLCWCAYHKEYINKYERDRVERWLRTKKPNDSQYTEFTEHKDWMGLDAWWGIYADWRETKKQKIKYLNILIKELEESNEEFITF